MNEAALHAKEQSAAMALMNDFLKDNNINTGTKQQKGGFSNSRHQSGRKQNMPPDDLQVQKMASRNIEYPNQVGV